MKSKCFYISCLFIAFLAGILSGCGKKSVNVQPTTLLDTPEMNYNAGMRALEKGNYDEALSSFERARLLDSNYVPAYVGVGLAYLGKGRYDLATKSIKEAKKKNFSYAGAYVGMGRIYATQGKIKNAINEFREALKYNPKSEDAYFYMGQAYETTNSFDQAGEAYTNVLKINPNNLKADAALATIQKGKRAAAGSPQYAAIATSKAINRADLAALFAVELNLEQTMKESGAPARAKWQPPPSLMGKRQTIKAEPITDIEGHWAKGYIQTVVDLGLMDKYPDGTFRPNEAITKANYAMFIERILAKALNDDNLSTRFIGNESPFPDVPDSHYAFNSIVVVTTRGIMNAKLNGEFGLTDTVSGADALVILRELKDLLRP